MNLYEQFPILKTIPIFSVASDDHVSDCFAEKDCTLFVFDAGEIIYSSELPGVRVGILLSGIAEIHTQGGDVRTLLKTATAGEMFGVANLYATDSAFPTVIRAREKTMVLFFDGNAFRRFIETNTQVLQFYLRFLSKKIVYLNRKIATFTAGSAEHRLALFLLENHTNGVFSPSYSMSTLANLLCLGRASLYRAIDKLTELSLIEHRDGCIYLSDPAALSAFSNPL